MSLLDVSAPPPFLGCGIFPRAVWVGSLVWLSLPATSADDVFTIAEGNNRYDALGGNDNRIFSFS